MPGNVILPKYIYVFKEHNKNRIIIKWNVTFILMMVDTQTYTHDKTAHTSKTDMSKISDSIFAGCCY